MRIKGLAGAAALCFMLSGAAYAFDAATDATSQTTPHGAPQDAGARSAKSIECSQKADAKELHGKARRHFMRECKHGA